MTFPHYLIPSNIASNNEITLISNWIKANVPFNYTLLYRASEDGDSSRMLYNNCYKNNKVLVLISTGEGWKFGEFANFNWKNPPNHIGYVLETNNNKFLFSLNNKSKYKLKY